MQVTETLSDGLKRAYTVVVPASEIETRRTAKLTELGRTLRVPGFRPGKVPMPMVRQRYGSAVTAEVLEESVNEATRQMIADQKLRPALQPKVDVVSADGAQDLEFKVEMEVLPDIQVPALDDIALTRLKAEPAAEVVDKALGEIAERRRSFEDVEETRPAAKGDVLRIDFVGRADGEVFQGGTGTDMDVEVGGSGFIPGFTEQMEGMSPGETRTIDVTFPEEYGVREMAGKAAQFEITAKTLRRKVVPPVDDALAKGAGFEDLDKLREFVTERIQGEYDGMSRMRLKRQLLDVLAERAAFPAPEGMVEAEFAQIWQRVQADKAAGRLDEEDREKDEDTLKAEYRAIADRRVRLGLLLGEIGRANSVTVGNDELTRAMRLEAMRYPGQEQAVVDFFRKNPAAVESLRGPIFEDKVVDFVLEQAKLEERQVSGEELGQDDEAA